MARLFQSVFIVSLHYSTRQPRTVFGLFLWKVAEIMALSGRRNLVGSSNILIFTY